MRHLTKRNDVYYFQRRIPAHLKDHFNGLASIKFSLKTRNLRQATILARQHSANYDKEFFQLDLALINKELENQHLPTAHRVIKHQPKQDLNEKAIEQYAHAYLEVPQANHKLSDCIEQYLSSKKLDNVSEKTLGRYTARLELLRRILKDKDINLYTRQDALSFKAQVVKLPPNINTNSKYKGKSIKEIIAMGDKPIGVHTINDTFKVVSGFFEWLVLNEKALKNPFTKLSVKKDLAMNEERKAFSRSDLTKIFTLDSFQKKHQETWHYWLPILGLYTGARINELCQLYRDNVREVAGIWCIDFNADREDQRLKTKSSWRIIPVHQKLIELGFIEFIQSIPMSGRIFPTLKYSDKDGYSKYPSKWFSFQRDKALTKKERERKTFHSLRHTVADELKQMGVEYSPASYILGHADDTMTYGRYGKSYSPKNLKPIIDKLNFDLPISAWHTIG